MVGAPDDRCLPLHIKTDRSQGARYVLRGLGRCLGVTGHHVATSLPRNRGRVLNVHKLVLEEAGVGRLRVDGLHGLALLLSELLHTPSHTLLGRFVDLGELRLARIIMLLGILFTRGYIGCHRLLV